MLSSFLAVLFFQGNDVARFDSLAQARDVAGLSQYATPELSRKRPGAFSFLKTGGAYGSGMHGWRVVPLRDAVEDREYAVFTTRFSSEDIGEQIFVVRDGKLVDYVPELDSQGVKLKSHALEIRILPAEKKVFAKDTVAFTKTSSEGKSFMVRLFPWYRVTSVRKSSGEAVPFRQGGGTVSLPKPSSDSFTYTFEYTGSVDLPGWAGSISEKEAQLTNDYWYPMVARQAAPYSLIVRTPASWIAIGQGDLVSDEVQGTERVRQYRMDLPVVYYSLSAAPYRSQSTEKKGVKYSTWSMEMTEEEMRLQNDLNAPVIDFFSKAFEYPYPFKQWGSLVSRVYGGGALEAYSYATYGTGWLPDTDGHEPSHTWWGGVIPNTYLKSFWNEGFANYSDMLYRREGGPGKVAEKRLAFVDWPQNDRAFLAGKPAEAGAEFGPAASSLGYGKGSYVLQMLESELGTDQMLKTMQHWLKTHPKGETGEWEDYERAVEQSTGKSYKWFFDQWIRRSGWADFDIKDVSYAGGKVKGKAVFHGEPYRLTLEVLVRDAAGNNHFGRARVDGAGPIEFESALTPKLVSFDPFHKLLRKSSADEAPVSIESFLRSSKRYTHHKRSGWLANFDRDQQKLSKLPADLDGVFVVGSPEDLPALRALFQRAGIIVKGSTATFDGTTIDLNQGAAIAVVPLGGGKYCGIGVGKTRLAPNTGHARIAVSDNYGRFLRGVTEPKTKGWGVFNLKP